MHVNWLHRHYRLALKKANGRRSENTSRDFLRKDIYVRSRECNFISLMDSMLETAIRYFLRTTAGEIG